MSPYLAESATLDILDSYDSPSPPEQERMPVGIDHNLNRPISLSAPTPDRYPVHSACNSSTNLVPVQDTTNRTHHAKSPSRSSPFYWNLPSQLSTMEEKRTQTVQNSTRPTKFWHGWKVILFGSCMCISLLVDCSAHTLTLTPTSGLNVLLVLIPISVQSNVFHNSGL